MFPIQNFTPRAGGLFCGLAALLLLAACPARKPAGPPPSIDNLTEVLKRTAEKKLGAPGLANEQIVVNARPEDAEARATEILNAAVAVGGTAIKAVEDGEISILANVPGHNIEIFKGLIRHESIDRQTSPPAPGQMDLIEVRVRTRESAAPASPTPP